jgi:hypothetical protein
MDRDLPPTPLKAMSRMTRAKTSMDTFISASPSKPILSILQSLAELLEIGFIQSIKPSFARLADLSA